VGQDSSVSIATGYGLDGPGIEFSTPDKTGPGVRPASYTMCTGSFPGVKRPGRGVDHPPHLALRLNKEYSIPLLPLWNFVACSRVNFTFTFTKTDGRTFSQFQIDLSLIRLQGHNVFGGASLFWCKM
jgi:hypothetical protein